MIFCPKFIFNIIASNNKIKLNKQYHLFIKLFEEKRMLCNDGKVYEAHTTWEHIWKEGDEEIREKIKQLNIYL